MSNIVVAVLGLVLAALLLLLIGQSLLAAFRRPGPSAPAMTAYSLSIGRGMLLVMVVGSFLLSTRLRILTGSSATAIGVIGILALLLTMVAETRWPRQTGAVRVATLGRPTLRESVEDRYLVGSGFAAIFVIGSTVFFLVVDPAVPSAPSNSAVFSGAGSLFMMGILAVLAVRQVLHRRPLAGVGTPVDLRLRTISAQRIIRALVTASLALVCVMCQDFRDALDPGFAQLSGLPQALSSVLLLVQVGCVLGALVLYQVGPTEKSMRKVGLLEPTTGR